MTGTFPNRGGGAGTRAAVRVRRHRRVAFAVLLGLDLAIVLLIRTSHRGTHIAESVVFPGAGLFENHKLLAAAFAIGVIAATVAWMAWGADWLVGAVWIAAILTTVALAPRAHPSSAGAWRPLRGTHEFPLVLAVTAAIGWAKSMLVRLPGVRQLRRLRQRRRSSTDRPPAGVVDTCRAASIAALAIDAGATDVDAFAHRRALAATRVGQRARRVGAVARWRFTGDPMRADQAATRTAQLLWGDLDEARAAAFVAEAAHRTAGVPASEPGWVRPIDGVLAAIAIDRCGASTDAWRTLLRERWTLRRNHRPAWCFEPLGLVAGSCPPWEHATMTALCRMRGWVGDEDWTAVRRAALGAAARHDGDAHDERLVAAARLWLTFVDDEQAGAIVARRAVGGDPISIAVSQLAAGLQRVTAGDGGGRMTATGVGRALGERMRDG